MRKCSFSFFQMSVNTLGFQLLSYMLLHCFTDSVLLLLQVLLYIVVIKNIIASLSERNLTAYQKLALNGLERKLKNTYCSEL